jgi:hypothetical protein
MVKKSIIVIFICLVSVVGYTQSITEFETAPVVVDGTKGLKIVAYNGTKKDVIIPEVLQGQRILEIGDHSFMFRGLTRVLIPEGIRVIGKQAFFGNQLRDVFIPRSVVTIGSAAFDNNRIINVYKNYTGAVDPLGDYTVRQTKEGEIVNIDIIPPQEKGDVIEPGILAKDPAVKPYSNSYVPLAQNNPVVSAAQPQRSAPTAPKAAPNQRAAPGPKAAPDQRAAPGPKAAPDQRAASGPKTAFNPKAERPMPPVQGPPGNRRDAGGSASVTGAYSGEPATGTFYLQNLGNGTATITGYRTHLKDAVVPERIKDLLITRIGTGAFMGKNLSSVAIPNSVEYIGDAAFASNLLSNVIIPESVRIIGNQAFAGNQIAGLAIGAGVIMQPDSFLASFGEFYDLNGKQGGTYNWNDGRWEYLGPAGVRSITEEYILPSQIRAMPTPP